MLHSYRLFVPWHLNNEFNTNYNAKYDSFFSLLLGKNINDKKEIIDIETFYSPTEQLITDYLHFVKMFVFQITNDLNHVFFVNDEEE